MADESKPTVFAKPRSGAPASDLGDAPVAAATGARYANRDEIARGGMGRVVEAADTLLGRIVAIKEVLSTDPELLRRFARETRITARLEHPSIVPLYDAGTTAEDVPYYVMRKVSGKPLEDLVAAADSVADRLALVPHLLATAQAVAHAHGRGILHRDLKPSNILVGDLGETVVIDWGLAKVVGEPDDDVLPAAVDAGESLRTRFGVVFGTPGFMAPEQVCGDAVDERADVYALGATLYFVLARTVPHHAASGDEMMAAAAAGPPRPLRELVAGVPPDLLTIVDTALAFATAERYRDAGAFAEELQRFLRGQLVAAHRYNRRERLARFVRRNRVAVLAVGLATLALAIGGAFSVARIVAERDRADASAQLAAVKQREAEAAEQREVERADQLLIAQARTAIETDPTLAVALLKQLRATPERWHAVWRTARAIAAQARDHGIAFGLPGPGLTIHLEQSPDGTHALAAGSQGELWIYDLGARTGHLLATLPQFSFTFASDREIHCHGETSLVVIDIATGVQTRHELGERIRESVGGGSTLLWTDNVSQRLHATDLTTAASTVLDEGIHSLLASPDRRFVVALGRRDARVYDLQAVPPRVVATQPGESSLRVWDADSRHVALYVGGRIAVLSLTGEPTAWFPTNGDVFGLVVGDHAPAITTVHDRGVLWAGHDGRFHVATTDEVERFAVPVGSRLALISGRQLDLFSRARQLKLFPPSEVDWIAGSSDGERLVATSHGRLLVWTLRALFPAYASLPHVMAFETPGAHDVVAYQGGELLWLDLLHETTRILTIPLVEPTISAVSDRVHLVVVSHGDAYLFTRDDDVAEKLPIADVGVAALDDERRVLVSTDHGALVRYDPTTRLQETLLSRPGTIDGFYVREPWQVALYTDGVVVRRNSTTGAITTIQLAAPVPPLERNVALGLTPSGDVTAASDRGVVRWAASGEVRELAAAPDSIRNLFLADDAALLGTANGALFTLGLAPPGPLRQERQELAPGSAIRSISRRAGLVTYVTPKGDPRIADLVAGESWPLFPALSKRVQLPHITEEATQMICLINDELGIFKLDLPLDERATAAWLDQLTNATTHGATSLDWE